MLAARLDVTLWASVPSERAASNLKSPPAHIRLVTRFPRCSPPALAATKFHIHQRKNLACPSPSVLRSRRRNRSEFSPYGPYGHGEAPAFGGRGSGIGGCGPLDMEGGVRGVVPSGEQVTDCLARCAKLACGRGGNFGILYFVGGAALQRLPPTESMVEC